MSESERISKPPEMVEKSAAVKPVHVYAMHLNQMVIEQGSRIFVIETNLSC